MRRMPGGISGLYRTVRRNRVPYLMLLPYTVIFFLLIILPLVSSVVLSFTNFNMLQFPSFNGLTNYIRLLFDDEIFLIAARNTLLFAFLTGPIGYVMSFVFAWFINDMGMRLRTFFTLVFYAPSLAGNVFFIWLYIFSGDAYGFVNSRLLLSGIIREPIQWLTDARYNLWIVVIVVLWLSMGTGFLAFIAGLQTLNRDLFEAGSIDGVKNRFQELFYITLPQMTPQLLFGAVMTIASSFAVGYQSMYLTGFPSTDYSTHTVVLHILDYGFIRYEMGYASAIAVVLFLAMLLVWKIIHQGLRRLGGDL